MKVELLGDHHNRNDFDCGVEPLNNYLKLFAGKHTKGKTGRTFILVAEENNSEVLGYYTLAVGSVKSTIVPVSMPHHPVPVVHLARLAVSKLHQGKKFGEFLLLDALTRAIRVEKEVAVYAVEVIAKDDNARLFYLKYGFKELLDDKLHLYLAIKRILQLGLY